MLYYKNDGERMIKLTRKMDGQELSINPDHIACYYKRMEHEETVVILYNSVTLVVAELPEMIEEIIDRKVKYGDVESYRQGYQDGYGEGYEDGYLKNLSTIIEELKTYYIDKDVQSVIDFLEKLGEKWEN